MSHALGLNNNRCSPCAGSVDALHTLLVEHSLSRYTTRSQLALCVAFHRLMRSLCTVASLVATHVLALTSSTVSLLSLIKARKPPPIASQSAPVTPPSTTQTRDPPTPIPPPSQPPGNTSLTVSHTGAALSHASLFQIRVDVPIDITRVVDKVEVKWHISGSLPLMLMLNGLDPDDTSTVLKELTIMRITKACWPVVINSAPEG